MGLGLAGTRLHIPSLARVKEAKLVAVCDRNEALAQQAASICHLPRYYTDFAPGRSHCVGSADTTTTTAALVAVGGTRMSSSDLAKLIRNSPTLKVLNDLVMRWMPTSQLVGDLGAGTGKDARLLKLLLPQGRVVCLDILASAIRYVAAKRISDYCIIGDATRLPFRAGAFDAVISDYIIEHVSDDALMVREITRVLAPGGIAVISAPVKLTGFALAFSINFKARRVTQVPSHVREYKSADDFVGVFPASMEVVDLVKYPFYIYPLRMVYFALEKLGLVNVDPERVEAEGFLKWPRFPRLGYEGVFAVLKKTK